MAVLPRRYNNCVFYVYPNQDDAKRGEARGGTGFFVGRATAHGWQIFLITNRHVIEPMTDPHIRVTTHEGVSKEERIYKQWWRYAAEDDLAAAEVDLPLNCYDITWIVERDGFLTDDIIRDNNIGPGDHIVMLGRFAKHDGGKQPFPAYRFGRISMLGCPPVENRYGRLQETIVAEYTSIGGFSGSPVFVYLPTPPVLSDSALEGSIKTWLCGVNYMHFQVLEKAEGSTLEVQQVSLIHSGLSGIIPASRVTALMNEFPAK